MLSGALALCGAWLVGSMSADDWATRFKGWCVQLWSVPTRNIAAALDEGTRLFAGCALTLGLAAAIPVALLGLWTTRGTFAAEHAVPKLANLSPGKVFSRLATSKHWLAIAQGVGVTSLVLAVLWVYGLALAKASLPALPGLLPLRAASAGLLEGIEALLMLVTVLGVTDYALELRRHHRELMMSRDEVKREYRNHEGDPRLKARRQARHRQLLAGGPQQGARAAKVVVVNPTHIAVALRYDDDECDAPYLVAKGRDEHAAAIRAEATAVGIPIVRDVPLARSLIQFELGEEIPEELYQAAAAVLKVAAENTPLQKGEER
jgi:type III secretion protein U